MNIGDIDLNLLVGLDAVFRTRSVSRAAAELGVTQSALSNSLRRLRRTLDDPLFVRSAGAMVPTPLCERIARSVGPALSQIERGLAGGWSFDAGRQARTYRLIMTDIAEAVLLPSLVEACRREAPTVSFRTIQLSTEETREALRSGEVDLAVGYLPDLRTGVQQQRLFVSDYVCMARRDHPTIGETISRAQFLAAEHALAEAAGTGHLRVEAMMKRAGIGGRISVRVPHFLALPFIVAASDMVATVPRPLAYIMRHAAATRTLEHPFPLAGPEIRQFWHERYNQDPANRWLRTLLRRVFAAVDWGQPGTPPPRRVSA